MQRDSTNARSTAILLCLLALSTLGCNLESGKDEPSNNGLPEAAVVAEMVFVVRVKGKGEDVRLKVPLPIASDHVRILDEEFRLRGFTMEEIMEDDLRFVALDYPALEGRRRFTYKALLAIDPFEHDSVSPDAPDSIPPELRRYTLPTPRLQSRSPLVRERLIEHIEPRLEAGETDLPRMIFGLVAGQFERRTAGGTSNVLKALRKGYANDRGLDRLLITFMRAAGIPARNVTGFRLHTGGRKLERWTEAYLGDEWVPMSTTKRWYGILPPDYVRMSHGERRMIEREGVERLTFKVLVRDPRPMLDVDAAKDDNQGGME